MVAALQARTPPAGLVLRSPFTELADVGAHHYPWLPVRLILRDRFEVVRHLASSSVPTTVIYGDRDSIVPAELSARWPTRRRPSSSASSSRGGPQRPGHVRSTSSRTRSCAWRARWLDLRAAQQQRDRAVIPTFTRLPVLEHLSEVRTEEQTGQCPRIHSRVESATVDVGPDVRSQESNRSRRARRSAPVNSGSVSAINAAVPPRPSRSSTRRRTSPGPHPQLLLHR